MTSLKFIRRLNPISIYREMAKYKRAGVERLMDQDEEDSTCSVQVDTFIQNQNNHHIKTHVLPIQPPGIWKARTPVEKFLIILSTSLTIAICISFIIFTRGLNSYILHLNPESNADLCVTPTCVKVAASILTSMDLSADPCNDFYKYACGGWVQTNPIPDGKSSWGTFQKLWQQNQLVMKIALEKKDKVSKSVAEKKARDYYTSCIDKNDTQEILGAKPLIDLLESIGGWQITPTNWSIKTWKFQTQLQNIHNGLSMGGYFSWLVDEDSKNSSRHVIQLDQGGLTLPTRDYYLNTTHQGVRDAYLDYMVKISLLMGATNETEARKSMKDIVEFETEIAKITIPLDARRDDEKLYHPMSIKELQKLSPFVSWKEYFNDAFRLIHHRDISHNEVVVVYAPEFLANLSKLIESKNTTEGKTILSNYLVWHTVKSMTCCLSKAFRDAEKILRRAILGSDGSEEEWKSCVSDVNNNLGFAVGAMFIRESFHSNSRLLAQEMIEHIRTAFQENLANLDWMDNETRFLAKDKISAISDMIGYPDFILNPKELDKKYDGLEISDVDYFGNNIRVNKYTLVKNLEKLDQPVNRTRWSMTAPTVNAYYTPTGNQMVIPAGILQQPFFDPGFPKSINYGAIGVVCGHELTHSLDDQGREYDKLGNLNQWWKNSTIDKFKNQTDCVVQQYSKYKIDGETVNGKQTLGENIADNGGLKASYHAYLKATEHENDLPLPGINLTHNQLFFLSFAQVWCSANLKETLILQIQNDPHVPAPLRVLGPLSNLPEFSEAFHCSKKAKYNPPTKDRCIVW